METWQSTNPNNIEEGQNLDCFKSERDKIHLSSPYLGTEVAKACVIQPRLLFRQLRQRHGVIQIKHIIRQGLRNASIGIVRHL